MGYRANPVLAALASHRFKGGTAKGTVQVAFIRHVEPSLRTKLPLCLIERGNELGYDVSVFEMECGRERALARELYHRGFMGIILGMLMGYSELPDMGWERFSVVCSGRNFFPTSFTTARPEIFSSFCLAWEQLRRRGYNRIGMAICRHDPEHEDDRARHAAALYCLERMENPAERIPPLRATLENARTEIVDWVQRYKPDAVLGFHAGYIHNLRDAGYRIPEDLGYASLHLLPQDPRPTLSAGLLHDLPEQHVKAMELLDQQLRHHVFGPVSRPLQVLLPQHWVEAPTVRPLPLQGPGGR